MASVLRFMERFRPGSTASVRGASNAQIAELAQPLTRGRASLPAVYVDFLMAMGENSDGIRLVWGSSSVSRLLEDRKDDSQPRVDPNQFFKYGIGELQDVGERSPDAFLDLTKIRADGTDAPMLEIRESLLVRRKGEPERPFACFSDQIRATVVGRFCLDTDPKRDAVPFSFGEDAGATARVFEVLGKLGFVLTELGASPTCIPMEKPREAVALLTAPSPTIPRTHLSFYAANERYSRYLEEVITDNEPRLSGEAP